MNELSEDEIPAPGIGVLTRLLSAAERRARKKWFADSRKCQVKTCRLAGDHVVMTVRAMGGIAYTKQIAILCPAHKQEVAQHVAEHFGGDVTHA